MSLVAAAAANAVASDTPLHCCAATERKQIMLACDAAADDVIESVPLATWGRMPSERIVCGDEAATQPTCTSDVSSQFRAACVGRSSCILDDTMLGDGCSEIVPKEAVVVVRWVCKSDTNPLPSARTAQFPPLPLRTEGRFVVDATGQRVRLKGVNWSGAQGHKRVVEGLNRAPLRDIARKVRELGFNFVRLPFSTELVLDDRAVEDHAVAANPHLIGMTALEIYDKVVDALGAEGVMVMIDNHMHDADWCCGNGDCNGLWFSPRYSTEDWIGMWRTMARRYKDVTAVVFASVKNEPRRVCEEDEGSWAGVCNVSFTGLPPGSGNAWENCVEAQWSTGPEHLQYRTAVTDVGIAILEEDPDVLISICGLNYGIDMQDVVENPVGLPAGKYMYESHEYEWFHSDEDLGGDGTTHITKLNRNWGNISIMDAAPVLVSEYGFAHDFLECTDDTGFCDKVRLWYQRAASYIQEKGPLAEVGGLDWAYWQLAGVQEGGRGRNEGAIETFGVMNECWTGPATDSHMASITALMAEPVQPTPAPAAPTPAPVAPTPAPAPPQGGNNNTPTIVAAVVVVVLIGVAVYFMQPQQAERGAGVELGSELNAGAREA